MISSASTKLHSRKAAGLRTIPKAAISFTPLKEQQREERTRALLRKIELNLTGSKSHAIIQEHSIPTKPSGKKVVLPPLYESIERSTNACTPKPKIEGLFPLEESKESLCIFEDSPSPKRVSPLGYEKFGRLQTLNAAKGAMNSTGAILVDRQKQKPRKGLTLARQSSLEMPRQISLETNFARKLPRDQIQGVQKRFTRMFLRKLLAKAYLAFDKYQKQRHGIVPDRRLKYSVVLNEAVINRILCPAKKQEPASKQVDAFWSTAGEKGRTY